MGLPGAPGSLPEAPGTLDKPKQKTKKPKKELTEQWRLGHRTTQPRQTYGPEALLLAQVDDLLRLQIGFS